MSEMRRKNLNVYQFIMETYYNDDENTTEVIYHNYNSEDDAFRRLQAEYFIQKVKYESQGDAITECCLNYDYHYGWLSTESGIHIKMSIELAQY